MVILLMFVVVVIMVVVDDVSGGVHVAVAVVVAVAAAVVRVPLSTPRRSCAPAFSGGTHTCRTCTVLTAVACRS